MRQDFGTSAQTGHQLHIIYSLVDQNAEFLLLRADVNPQANPHHAKVTQRLTITMPSFLPSSQLAVVAMENWR